MSTLIGLRRCHVGLNHDEGNQSPVGLGFAEYDQPIKSFANYSRYNTAKSQ